MIFPSIDLSEGKAVQLKQGRDKALEREDWMDLAREFARFGEVAVIDLDAALGRGDNGDIVREICRRHDCRVGGGIRTVERALEVLDWGAERIILGTRAFRNGEIDLEFLEELASAVERSKIVIAVDTLYGEIVTRGWRQGTGMKVLSVIDRLQPYAGEFLFTCVEKEGLMQGADAEPIRKLAEAAEIPVTAAGGITTPEEIAALSYLGVNVQLGMAVYTGALELSEAFAAALDWKADMIPTIAQDEAGRVLMLAYSNRDAVLATLKTGDVRYYSRSRKRLWRKGETSGHTQSLVRARTDCDGDALLYTVIQEGPACHTGRFSCFGGRRFELRDLTDVVVSRIKESRPDSYTASLSAAEVRQKLSEEAGELIEAETKEEKIWEAADLLYFWTVLLAKEGIDLDEVLHELKRRRRKKAPSRNAPDGEG